MGLDMYLEVRKFVPAKNYTTQRQCDGHRAGETVKTRELTWVLMSVTIYLQFEKYAPSRGGLKRWRVEE